MTWDSTKPVASSNLVSSEIRQNWDAIESSLLGMNLLADPELRIWAAGTSAVPTYFFTAGTAPTITQCGIGLGDTTRKYGPFSIKAVGGGATGYIGQIIIPATANTYYGWDSYFTDTEFTAGAYIKTSDVNACRVGIGETTTSLDPGSYHTGSGNWEWLTGPKHTVTSATVVAWMAEIGAGKTVYISGPTATFGGITPSAPMPCHSVHTQHRFEFPGNFTVGTRQKLFHPYRPALIKDILLYSYNAPLTTSLIADVNTWDGAAQTSMCTTKPTVPASSNYVVQVPDGLYARRCLAGFYGTYNPGTFLTVDIDAVGSGSPGSDGYLCVRYMEYIRAFESLHAYNT